MDNEIEIWKSIPGYENSYQASSLGRIKSMSRVIRYIVNEVTFLRIVKERILNQYLNKKTGYLMLALSGDTKSVHRLVCAAFHQNNENLPTVNHEDGIKINNREDNLKWSSSSGNSKHAYDNGLLTTPRQRGWTKANRKLSDEQVLLIRESKVKDEELANIFNVSRSSIWAIKTKRTFKDL